MRITDRLPLVAFLALAACGDGTSKPTAPAHAQPVAHEADLLRLSLSPQAQKRLGIETVRVDVGSSAGRRETSGEIVAPNAAGGVPTGSLSNLAQIGASQAAADGEVARTQAQLQLARVALARATALVREEAGSIRARDEAAAALANAQAQAQAAVAQRRLLGPAVATLGRQPVLWVRVPVFGTDVAALTRQASVEVRPLGNDGAPRSAKPVQAPPSANAAAGTVDLYYAVGNRDGAFRVGQRVAVSLPLRGQAHKGLSVPASAIVRDIYGGEWVYRKTAANNYIRQRIEVASVSGGSAILGRGLAHGAEIVSVGAMELFGTEFGVAH